MKRFALMLTLLLLALAVFSGCGGEEEVLTLYTWEGMFPDEIIDGFEKETGIKVRYENFDYDETMLAKLQETKGGGYDLVIADDYIIEIAIEEGLVSKLDTSKLENYENINPYYQSRFYDPKNEYTVPYGAGVQTIVYDPFAVPCEINGYADLWNEELKDNIGIIANYRVINGMALKVMGESYNTEDTAKIAAAGERLGELAGNIRLIKDDNLQDDLISGEVSVAVMYTSQVTVAKMTNPTLKVVYPEEGIGLGIMAGFIPSDAPNAEAAYKFLDYILDAENGAKCFEHLGYYCTYSASDEYISEEYREFLTLPEGIDMNSSEMIEMIGAEADEAHMEAWVTFKSLCE